jgi:hypothetical protein
LLGRIIRDAWELKFPQLSDSQTIPKSFHTYTMNSLRAEKSLRDTYLESLLE